MPAMACVGGPAVCRGARRRRDLLRRSATSAPTRLLTRLDRLWTLFDHKEFGGSPCKFLAHAIFALAVNL